jgi:hypothetical protein
MMWNSPVRMTPGDYAAESRYARLKRIRKSGYRWGEEASFYVGGTPFESARRAIQSARLRQEFVRGGMGLLAIP